MMGDTRIARYLPDVKLRPDFVFPSALRLRFWQELWEEHGWLRVQHGELVSWSNGGRLDAN